MCWYRLASGVEFQFFDFEIAWCAACEDFVIVEQLEPLGSIEEELSKYESTRDVWLDLDAEEEQKFAELDVKISCKGWHENRYRVCVAKLEWRKSRKSPIKCLDCGSVFGIRRLPQDRAFNHPVNGKNVEIRSRGYLGGPPAPDRFFDGEGNRLVQPNSLKD